MDGLRDEDSAVLVVAGLTVCVNGGDVLDADLASPA